MANGERRRDRGTDRAKAWQAMRIMMRFDRNQLEITSEITQSNASRYLRALVRAGYLRVVRTGRGGPYGASTIYQMIRNTGPKPPVELPDGAVYDPNTGETVCPPEMGGRHPWNKYPSSGPSQHPLCARIWEAIRARNDQFTTVDLAADCSCSPLSVRSYLRWLIVAGYVQEIRRPRRRADARRNRVYRLVRDTGSKHPMVLSEGRVLDQNTGVTYGGEQGHG